MFLKVFGVCFHGQHIFFLGFLGGWHLHCWLILVAFSLFLVECSAFDYIIYSYVATWHRERLLGNVYKNGFYRFN